MKEGLKSCSRSVPQSVKFVVQTCRLGFILAAWQPSLCKQRTHFIVLTIFFGGGGGLASTSLILNYSI